MSGDKSPHEDLIAINTSDSGSTDTLPNPSTQSGPPDPREQKAKGGGTSDS
jgi:hypothetical protein